MIAQVKKLAMLVAAIQRTENIKMELVQVNPFLTNFVFTYKISYVVAICCIVYESRPKRTNQNVEILTVAPVFFLK